MFPGMTFGDNAAPGFSGSSSATATAGPVTVGGLTFSPQRSDAMQTAAVVVALGLLAVVLLKRK